MTFNELSWVEGTPGEHMVAMRTTNQGVPGKPATSRALKQGQFTPGSNKFRGGSDF